MRVVSVGAEPVSARRGTVNTLLRMQRLGSCARAGKFGTSAAIGQVLPPKAQMVAQQDWKYVSGGGRVRGARLPCPILCKPYQVVLL